MDDKSTFLTDYLHFNSGNMIPQRYHHWVAVSIIGATLGRKVYVDHNYFKIIPNNYICLVGRQGFRKGSAKDRGMEVFSEALPDYPLGSSVQSREDIVKRLATAEMEQEYLDEHNTTVKWKPLMFFVNELKNFMSINPQAMVDFLTDIYDRSFFDASTIKHGLQEIWNPCINILSCETPAWIIEKLKFHIITGGFSRRMIYVYETVPPTRITFPVIPPGGLESRQRCVDHLRFINDKLRGPMEWEPSARDFFDKWFKALKSPDDPILEGFYEAKDVLALKIAMCLAAMQYKPKLLLTIPLLVQSIAMLESIETNLPKLTVAAGRSDLALPQANLLEVLERHGGVMERKDLVAQIDRDMNPSEQGSVIGHLKANERIQEGTVRIRSTGESKVMLMSPEGFKRVTANGGYLPEEPTPPEVKPDPTS